MEINLRNDEQYDTHIESIPSESKDNPIENDTIAPPHRPGVISEGATVVGRPRPPAKKYSLNKRGDDDPLRTKPATSPRRKKAPPPSRRIPPDVTNKEHKHGSIDDAGKSKENQEADDTVIDDDAVIEIPDMEHNIQANAAPSLSGATGRTFPHLPTMEELECHGDIQSSMNISHMISSAPSDVDLSVLTRRLIPFENLAERKDEVWEFESLLRAVEKEMKTNAHREL